MSDKIKYFDNTAGNLITESTIQVDTEGHSTGESTKLVDGQNTIGATKSCTSKPKKPNEPSTRKHDGTNSSGKTTGGCLRNPFALYLSLLIKPWNKITMHVYTIFVNTFLVCFTQCHIII